MADRLYTYWYDSVLPDMKGCAITVANFAIKRAAIEFLDRSNVWQLQLTAIASIIGVQEYALPDAGAANRIVGRVLEARFLGTRMKAKTPNQLKAIFDPVDWRTTPNVATPLYWLQTSPNEIRIVPAPNANTASAINGLWVTVRPKDDATGFEEKVAIEWHEAIMHGAKRNLQSQPDKPYTNEAMAREHGAAFEAAIKRAQWQAFKGQRGRANQETSQ